MAGGPHEQLTNFTGNQTRRNHLRDQLANTVTPGLAPQISLIKPLSQWTVIASACLSPTAPSRNKTLPHSQSLGFRKSLISTLQIQEGVSPPDLQTHLPGHGDGSRMSMSTNLFQ